MRLCGVWFAVTYFRRRFSCASRLEREECTARAALACEGIHVQLNGPFGCCSCYTLLELDTPGRSSAARLAYVASADALAMAASEPHHDTSVSLNYELLLLLF